MPSSIPVFFRTEAVPQDLITCKPIEKFQATFEDWRRRFPDRLAFPSFERAAPELVKLAHAAEHVDGILAGTRRNGFGNLLPSVGQAALWEVGAFLASARAALDGPASVAASITGGFHHARHQYSHAFCTFNGLMVAALALRNTGRLRRVAILDLDHHFGDGTHSVIEATGAHDLVDHYSYAHQLLGPADVEGWLDGLDGVVRAMRAGGADILFYQAGADPHRDDPLARGVMTTDQLRRRDRIVFLACSALGLPVCWNLAGGYQRPVEKTVALYRATMEECLAAFP